MQQIKAYGTEKPSTPLHELTIERRAIQPQDIEMDILFCGICHSDLHQVKGDFGQYPAPIVPGHEILGKITAVGDHVKNFRVRRPCRDRLHCG